MSKALVPNLFVRWHFQEFIRRGDSIEQICQRFNVPPSIFDIEGNEVSADNFASMIKHSVEVLKDESFGAITRTLPVGSFAMMTHAAISCLTLKQAIHRCCKFYQLLSPQINWRLEVGTNESKIVFDTDTSGVSNESHGYFIVFTSCILWRWLSWMIDEPISLAKMSVSFSHVDASDYLPGIFKTNLYYRKSENAICFSNALLDKPVKQTPDTLQHFLVGAPECLLAHYQASDSLSKKVQEYIEGCDFTSDVTLQQTAEDFYCSEQSLIRGLKQEGTRFKDIREKVRKHKASYYLIKTSLTNQQISAQLGFSEVSVFYRNFKKWYGVTPSQYRENPKQVRQLVISDDN